MPDPPPGPPVSSRVGVRSLLARQQGRGGQGCAANGQLQAERAAAADRLKARGGSMQGASPCKAQARWPAAQRLRRGRRGAAGPHFRACASHLSTYPALPNAAVDCTPAPWGQPACIATQCGAAAMKARGKGRCGAEVTAYPEHRCALAGCGARTVPNQPPGGIGCGCAEHSGVAPRGKGAVALAHASPGLGCTGGRQSTPERCLRRGK